MVDWPSWNGWFWQYLVQGYDIYGAITWPVHGLKNIAIPIYVPHVSKELFF
jgi:hypothetical protein